MDYVKRASAFVLGSALALLAIYLLAVVWNISIWQFLIVLVVFIIGLVCIAAGIGG
jgi:hypothetical protein